VVRGCFVYPTTWFIYWPIALVFAYSAIAAFYFSRSRKRGVGTPIWPYVIAGVIVAALVTLHAWWDFSNPFGAAQQLLLFQAPLLTRLLTGPIPTIGLGLLVLAWVERNRALLVFAPAYLVVVLVPIDFGWVMARSWVFLPHLVIAGGLLLLGAAAFAVAERTRRQTR
jgi:hypothetical protein